MKIQDLTCAAECLKALAHPTRMGIILSLGKGERNVKHLMAELCVSQSNTSQHLSIMKNKGILVDRREGNEIYYRVKIPQAVDIVEAVKQVYCDEESQTLNHPDSDDGSVQIIR